MMSTPSTGLLATVIETLAEHDTSYHVVGDDVVTFHVASERATHRFLVMTDDGSGLVTLTVQFGPRVPDARRVAVAETIARINPGLGVGHFELDFDDGDLRFRITTDVEGGFLAGTMVDNMVRAALWSCERYLLALMGVAFGGDEPAIAVVAAVEG